MLAETDVVMVGGGLAGRRDPLPAELDGGAEPRS